MRFRLFHVLLMGDAVWASGGGGVWRKKILICLWLWKNMHIHLAFRFSKGRTEEMGTCLPPHCGGAAAWLHVHVTVRTCLWERAIFLLLNDPVFSLHLCSYHSNTNGSSTAERSCALSHSLNIHLTERRRGWQSASLAGRRLTGFLSVWLTDWLVIRGLGPCWLITCEGVNKVTSWRAGASTGPAADWLVDSRED